VHIKKFFVLSFLKHMLISYWIAASSSSPPISFITSNTVPITCLSWDVQDDQPIHVHPEDSDFSVSQNVVQLTIFEAAHKWRPKFTLNASRKNLRSRLTYVPDFVGFILGLVCICVRLVVWLHVCVALDTILVWDTVDFTPTLWSFSTRLWILLQGQLASWIP
jgi:hypothetical protein